MRARRKDANHVEVGDYLRELGWSVLDLAKHGVSVDYAVGRHGQACLVEVKDGTKPPSARQLTKEEKRLRDNWIENGGPYVVATGPEDAEIKLNRLLGSMNESEQAGESDVRKSDLQR